MFNTEIGIEDEKRDRWSAADLEGYLFRQRYPQDILLSEQYPSLLELPDLLHRRFQFMRELTRKHRREYLDVLVRPKTGNQMVFLTEGPIKGGKDGVVLSEEQDNRLIQ